MRPAAQVSRYSVVQLSEYMMNVVGGQDVVIILSVRITGTNPGHVIGQPICIATQQPFADNLPMVVSAPAEAERAPAAPESESDAAMSSELASLLMTAAEASLDRFLESFAQVAAVPTQSPRIPQYVKLVLCLITDGDAQPRERLSKCADILRYVTGVRRAHPSATWPWVAGPGELSPPSLTLPSLSHSPLPP